MENESETRLFEQKKGKQKIGRQTQKALDTFLRNSYRTHTGLSALADKKANILIRFNSIIISILLIFFKEIVALNPFIVYSGFSFLFSSLISLVFATLAARPHVTKLNNSISPVSDVKQNLFFFGNFTALTQSKYELAVNQMKEDKELIYGNMIRDIYHLGKVLEIKFKYIHWSYNAFLIGLTISVLAFIFSFLFTNV